jgi:hypothetical protein
VDEIGGACSTHGRDEKCIQNISRKTWKTRQLWRPKHRWEDNIKTNLTERERECVYWIHLAQRAVQWRALVNTVMDLLGSIKVEGVPD